MLLWLYCPEKQTLHPCMKLPVKFLISVVKLLCFFNVRGLMSMQEITVVGCHSMKLVIMDTWRL